jgi:hypothetical protein
LQSGLVEAPMDNESLVRASIPKSSWTELQRLPPAQREAVERSLGEQFIGELSQALTVAWVPFAVEARLADAIYEVLGAVETRAFYKRKTLASFDIPLLKPLLESTMRLFGATPVSFLKMLGRTWSTLSKNCGSYDWIDEKKERRGVSLVRGFPTRLYRREQAWVESALGGYEGFFVPLRLEGRVRAEEVDFRAGNSRFILEW